MRNQRSLKPRSSLLLLTATLVACSAPPPGVEALGQNHDAALDDAAPYRSDFTFYADTGDRGQIADAAYDATSTSDVHGGVFSNGRDSASPVTPDASTWFGVAAGSDWSQFESAPLFTSKLAAAQSDAEAHKSTLSTDTLDGIADDLHKYLEVNVTERTVTDTFVGFAPEQARWLTSQYEVVDASRDISAQYSYPDPSIAGEIKERGARLYCAAREAIRQQAANPATRAMGKQVALPLTILGHAINIGVVEATLALDGPEREDGAASDGAQAFHVPMRVGTRFTPIEGVHLPGFAELRHPIDLVTGDTEVISGMPKQDFITGVVRICKTSKSCRNVITTAHDYPQQYKTVTHADAFASRSAHIRLDYPPIPLFVLGAFNVMLKLGGDVSLGTALPGVGAAYDDRMLNGVPSGWPATARADLTSSSPWSGIGYGYDDGSWWPSGSPDDPVSGPTLFSLPASSKTFAMDRTSPMLMRALHDDDHHIQTESRMSMDATVEASFDLHLGLATLTLTADGTAGIGLAHQTDVRDAEFAIAQGAGSQAPPLPVTGLTVTPMSEANVSLGLTANLHIHVTLPFKSIDKDFSIVNASTGKTWPSGPWADEQRLRLATGSEYGDPTNQPWAESHLPNTSPTTFSSFAESVPACLANTSPNPVVPAGCESKPPGTAPHGEICVFSGSWDPNFNIGTGAPDPWVGACEHIPTTVDEIDPLATPAQKGCYTQLLGYLCAPTSKEQTYLGRQGVGHVLEAEGSTALGDVIATCNDAFDPMNPDPTFTRLFQFGPCDDAATMIAPGEVVKSGATPDTTPPAVTPSDCY